MLYRTKTCLCCTVSYQYQTRKIMPGKKRNASLPKNERTKTTQCQPHKLRIFSIVSIFRFLINFFSGTVSSFDRSVSALAGSPVRCAVRYTLVERCSTPTSSQLPNEDAPHQPRRSKSPGVLLSCEPESRGERRSSVPRPGETFGFCFQRSFYFKIGESDSCLFHKTIVYCIVCTINTTVPSLPLRSRRTEGLYSTVVARRGSLLLYLKRARSSEAQTRAVACIISAAGGYPREELGLTGLVYVNVHPLSKRHTAVSAILGVSNS